MDKLIQVIGFALITLALLAVFSVIAAIPTYFLWNWLMPTLFGIKAITFAQAVGVNFMTAILFKSQTSANSSSKK